MNEMEAPDNRNSLKTEVKPEVEREVEPEAVPLTWMFWRKRRYIVVLLAFLGYISNYTLRVNLSVAIVAMTEIRYIDYGNGTFGEEQYFDWSSQERGLILSSFFWGYIFTQFAGGFFAKKFGGNLIFGLGIGLTAVLGLVTPWLGRTVTSMIVIRVLQGLFEGVTFPCIHDLWFYWAPISERSRMASIAYSGMYMGSVITMPVSAVLATSLGWESCFYVFGGLGILWYILWAILVRSSPDKDRFISKDELEYIQRTVHQVKEEKRSIPWKSLLTSKPVWAIIATHTTENWGSYTTMTQMPMFLKDALNYDLGSSGILSAAPAFTMFVLVPITGYVADFLENRGILTTTQIRKFINCGAMALQFLCLIFAGFLIHPVWSVVLLILGVGGGGVSISIFSVNPLDIAPPYASVVLGLSNTFATLPGIISPALTGYLVQNQTVEEWRVVFYITAGLYVFGGIVYWLWCSGEVQPWSVSKIEDIEAEKEKEKEK